MDKHLSKLFILIIILVLVLGGLYVFETNQKNTKPISQETSYAPPVVKANSPQITDVVSPDGKAELTMKEEKNKADTTYTFTIRNISDNVVRNEFTKTVPVGTSISVPLNTFSPDDKYIFLKETNGKETSYFVPLKDKTLDILSMFAEKHPEYKITDVTGWGGMTLIVINTDKVNGGTGPSFWLDVTSDSFIQLTNRFN